MGTDGAWLRQGLATPAELDPIGTSLPGDRNNQRSLEHTGTNEISLGAS
jgi:hypothetical protein